MSEADAADRARKNGFNQMERVPGSEKCYDDVDGG